MSWHLTVAHDDVIRWKHFPRYWPFVRGIHRFPVNSPHYGQWRGALMFSLICVWINGWVNNRESGDLRRYCAHYDVIVMKPSAGTVRMTELACLPPTFLLLLMILWSYFGPDETIQMARKIRHFKCQYHQNITINPSHETTLTSSSSLDQYIGSWHLSYTFEQMLFLDRHFAPGPTYGGCCYV